MQWTEFSKCRFVAESGVRTAIVEPTGAGVAAPWGYVVWIGSRGEGASDPTWGATEAQAAAEAVLDACFGYYEGCDCSRCTAEYARSKREGSWPAAREPRPI